jgi:hypothetical protein
MRQISNSEKKDPAQAVVDDWQERSKNERRSESDKRRTDSTSYLTQGGKERRKIKERRKSGERREKWMRVGKWRSISVFDE